LVFLGVGFLGVAFGFLAEVFFFGSSSVGAVKEGVSDYNYHAILNQPERASNAPLSVFFGVALFFGLGPGFFLSGSGFSSGFSSSSVSLSLESSETIKGRNMR
jgi:hypothetical protein